MEESKRRRRRRLTHLKIDEIALVDRGANPGAKVLLCKRQEGNEMETREDVEAVIKREVAERLEADRTGFLASLTPEQRYARILEDEPQLLLRYDLARKTLPEPPQTQPLHKIGSARARAWENIQAAAAELLSEESSLTEEAAVVKVLECNPELYTEYLAAAE